MSDFNKRERQLISLILTAKTNVDDGWELEIDHMDGDEGYYVKEPGWYAMQYSEKKGYADSINNEWDEDPLITDDEIREHNVDIHKVLERIGCYWCG